MALLHRGILDGVHRRVGLLWTLGSEVHLKKKEGELPPPIYFIVCYVFLQVILGVAFSNIKLHPLHDHIVVCVLPKCSHIIISSFNQYPEGLPAGIPPLLPCCVHPLLPSPLSPPTYHPCFHFSPPDFSPQLSDRIRATPLEAT